MAKLFDPSAATSQPSDIRVRVGFAIPGDPDQPTGGYIYDRRVMALLGEHGIDVEHVRLSASFPAPGDSDLAEAERLLGGDPSDGVLLIDGLAYGALPADLIERINHRIIALVHHPLCLEEGLPRERADALRASETAALAKALHVIVTSPATARLLINEFGVDAARVTIAEPGTDPAPRASGTGKPLYLLAVGSVVPRKGYGVLVDALAPLADRGWRLSIAGALDRDCETARGLVRQIELSGLQTRITLAGAVGSEDLRALYQAADVFVMPSLFEGYGMAIAEAMSYGLPIVCTTGGAAADTAPDTAAIKVAPGDAAALGSALARLMDDPSLRHTMADAAWAAGQALPRWSDTTTKIASVIRGVSR